MNGALRVFLRRCALAPQLNQEHEQRKRPDGTEKTDESMSRRSATIFAFAIAGLLTAVGWQQVMIYKAPPVQKLELWFPFLCFGQFPNEVFRVLITLIQFPFFATAFALGIKRWKSAPVLTVVLLIYALCVCTAFVRTSS
jgi:hypothetical protein